MRLSTSKFTLALMCTLILAPTNICSNLVASMQDADQQCPSFEIQGPKKSKVGLVQYRAKFKKLVKGQLPVFEWSIDGGTIVSGQGTADLTVEPTSREITVSLAILNFSKDCARAIQKTEITGNFPPSVKLAASSATVVIPCPPGTASECSASTSRTVNLAADAHDLDDDVLLYTWAVTGGFLNGDGRSVSWDLSGMNPGTYTATVSVHDGNSHIVSRSISVTVAQCLGCEAPCPGVGISSPSDVDEGAPITFSTSAGDSNVTYNWSVSAGTITSGQGTSSITVDTTGVGGQTVTATIEIGGLAPSCSRSASATTSVRGAPLTALITGVVKDVNGQPLKGAHVSAINQHGFSMTAFTQADGTYVLRPLALGTYKVTASFDSYSPQTQTVGLPSLGDMGQANFNLRKR